MMSIPAIASVWHRAARRSGGSPWGLSAAQVSGRVATPEQFANPGNAKSRTAELRHEIRGKLHIDQLDVIVQRAIAEQHVDGLRDVAAGGRGRQANAHLVHAIVAAMHTVDASDNMLGDERIADDFGRDFDALLERDGRRHGVQLFRRRAHAIGDVEPRHVYCFELTSAYSTPRARGPATRHARSAL